MILLIYWLITPIHPWEKGCKRFAQLKMKNVKKQAYFKLEPAKEEGNKGF